MPSNVVRTICLDLNETKNSASAHSLPLPPSSPSYSTLAVSGLWWQLSAEPVPGPEAGPRVPTPPVRPPFRSVVFIARPRDILTLKTPEYGSRVPRPTGSCACRSEMPLRGHLDRPAQPAVEEIVAFFGCYSGCCSLPPSYPYPQLRCCAA